MPHGGSKRRYRIPTGACWNETGGPLRGLRCRLCWLICSSIMRSMRGWPGNFRASRSSGMWMTRWCTASANARHERCWRRSRSGWRRSGCGCIPTRPGSCTARTGSGVPHMSIPSSRSWGSRSASVGCGPRAGSSSTRSIPRSAGKPCRKSVRRCAPGDCTTAPVLILSRWRSASIRSSAVGWTTTVRSTGRRCTRSCNASTPTWCGGSARSTSGCGRRRRPSGVGGGSSSEPRACSRTGNGFLPSRLSGDQDDKSPVTGDCYAGICGSPGLKCPGPPDLSDLAVKQQYTDALARLGGPDVRLAGPAADALRSYRLEPQAVQWLQTNFLKTELELGHCLRLPQEGPCECDLMLACSKFVTTSDYAPRLRARRDLEQQLVDDADARGWTREAERHQSTQRRIDQLLNDLAAEPEKSPCQKT